MKRTLIALTPAIVCAVLVTGAPRAQMVPSGLDLLETDPATTYQDVNLPPGFLAPYCDAGFVGRIYARGEPFDCYGGVCGLFPADTIVQRQAAAPQPTASIPIEIVRLELRSVSPITVNCTGGDQTWNVSASIPEGDPNQAPGTMTINHTYQSGGTFTSSFPVRPLITFTRVSDNSTVGPILSPPINFSVSAPMDWCHRANPLDDPVGDYVPRYDSSVNFFPGVICPNSPGGGGQRKKVLTLEQAAQAAHGVFTAEKKHHYKCFKIAGAPLGLPLTAQDQFGSQSVILQQPLYLCPPAKKFHFGAQYGSLNDPHLKCYALQGGVAPGVKVDLKTQFGYEKNVVPGPPTMMCTPANKEVIFPAPVPPPAGAPPPAPQYTCYPIGGPPPAAVVALQTQFGLEPSVTVNNPVFLCAPTIKNGSTGSLQEPHLKCYDINGSNPPHIVNLTTQFGVENNVNVDVAKLLCVPATKRPPECEHTTFVSKTTLVWDAVTLPSTQYNVYRGDVDLLPTNYGTCFARNLLSPNASDGASPPTGHAFFYNPTAFIPSHDGPVEGTLGFASNAIERPNLQTCDQTRSCVGGKFPGAACSSNADCPGGCTGAHAGMSCLVNSDCTGICSTDPSISCTNSARCRFCVNNHNIQCTTNAQCGAAGPCGSPGACNGLGLCNGPSPGTCP